MYVFPGTKPLVLFTFLLFAMVLSIPKAHAQFYGTSDATQPDNKVYLEGFGTGGFYSLNYERSIKGGLNARIGVAYMPQVMSEYTAQVIVPVTVSYLAGYSGHHLEVGASVTHQIYGSRRDRSLPGPFQDREALGVEYVPGVLFGYRYQAPDGGWIFRATYTPFNMKLEGWVSSAGMSVGYAF
jgi:hypothetical protein